MASIVALSRAPELLDSILQYLSDSQVLNLSFACKTLYPPCSRYLWTTLRVTESIYSSPGRIISSKWSVDTVVEKYWSKSKWIRYTRYVVFGRAVNRFSETSEALIQLLEDKILYPNRMELDICLTNRSVEPNYKNLHTASLVALKRYSQSRSSQEFSILLQSNVVRLLPELVDLTKVTKLSLGLLVPTTESKSVTQAIQDLATVLQQSVNLTYFLWEGDLFKNARRCRISAIEGTLQTLQAACTKLRYLKVLKIRRFLFHPSFFLVPPQSARELSLECIVTEAWWQSFAACALPNVENLSINYIAGCQSTNELHGFVERETVQFDKLALGDVAVRGLKKFACNRSSSNIPLDLLECISRNNKELDRESRKELKRHDAERLLRECYLLFDQESSACQQLAVDRYTRRFAAGYKATSEKDLDFMAEYAQILVQLMRLGDTENLGAWIREKEHSESIENRNESSPKTQIKEFDPQNLTRDVVEKARALVVPAVYEFSGALRRLKGRAVGNLAAKLIETEGVSLDVAMDIWADKALTCIRNVRQGVYDFD